MSRLSDDPHRPSRPRANTSSFAPFIWRRGRAEVPLQPPLEPVSLSSEALLDLLSPPAVPSLTNAKSLAAALAGNAPRPRLAAVLPVVTTLCASESPSAVQAAGFDVLTAFWSHSDLIDLTTADKLSCLSLVLNMTNPWAEDVWESKFRALMAFTRSGTETVGLERALLRVLRTWIEGAFTGLAGQTPGDDRLERQRSIETMANFHLSIVARQDFVARLSTEDVAGVLQLYGGLTDMSLSLAAQGPASELPSPLSPPVRSPFRLPLRHGRSPSSDVVPAATKHPVDLAVELFLNYLQVRLNAIAPDHLSTIVTYLFRALSWYTSSLPRLSLNAATIQQNPIEKRITEVLDTLVTGSYAASCAIILKRNLFPTVDVLKSTQTALGALRTLRASIRRTLITRLARSYINRTSSAAYTQSGAPAGIDLQHSLMERAWSRDDVAVWGLSRFRCALCTAVEKWLAVSDEKIGSFKSPVETVLNETAGLVVDMTHAIEETADGEDPDEEDIQGVNDILTALVAYIPSRRYACFITFVGPVLTLRTQSVPRYLYHP